MPLDLVSETYVEDHTPKEPKYRRAYDLKPPFALNDSLAFTVGQPFESFAKMREAAPVMWHPEQHAAGFWALTRYDDVRKVELDTQTFSSQRGGILMGYGKEDQRHPLLHRASLDTLICLDQPHHMALRREHMAYFLPNFVADLRKRVEAKVDSLLDDMAAKGPQLDMVEHFSAELPLFTLCEILGVPDADRPKLVHWMHYLENAGYMLQRKELGEIEPEVIMDFLANVQDMFDYGQAILQERRKNPKNDLLSAIANAEIDGQPLSPEYLDGSWLLIVFAGNDTTRNSLSGTMKLLTEFPDQQKMLVESPEKIGNMVHEAIRMVSPVIYMRRTATKDTEIGGQKIGEGEKLVMYYGAANRDPSIFPEPDTFDIQRGNAKAHLAFGMGPHVCLGQRVANMQLEVAYQRILARFPEVKWTGDIEIAPNNFVHAISKLQIDLGS